MSYMSTHNRLRRTRGSASSHACVACLRPAQEWAYNNASASEEIDLLGRRYSRDLADYQPMCFRCHRLMDKASITHCPQGHEYAGHNVMTHGGKRKCRTCHNARMRQRVRTPAQKARQIERQRESRRKAKEAAA